METKLISLNSPQEKISRSNGLPDKADLAQIFDERNMYLNEYILFVTRFNSIPNVIEEVKIDCRKADKWFAATYRNSIRDMHFSKGYYKSSRNAEKEEIFYILYEDLIVYFEATQSQVKFLFRKTEASKVETLIKEIKKFRRKKRQKSEIELLVNTGRGIATQSLNIVKTRLGLEDNYNNDFKTIHQTIIKRLSKKNDKGLVLLHGKPGTGKTSYIRYLISHLNKKVIFLPPNMAGAITNPNLISILIDNPNSVFVIEDAENIVVDREKDGDSPVSALLNISDGLLSDCLNIQIICSFNTDISKVDSALMRKGRLIAKYEFKELEVEKAQALSKKLGFNTKFTSPVTLTEIYNQEEKILNRPKRVLLVLKFRIEILLIHI